MKSRIFLIIVIFIILSLILLIVFQKNTKLPDLQKCAEEGEMISTMPGPAGEQGIVCCEGLNQGNSFSIINGSCSPETDVSICINCPNSECGPGENKCNCPEDCE